MTETAVLAMSGVHVTHPVRGGGLLGRDRVHAVTEADLAVAAGETVGIVGESGCGKSTVATVLVGLRRPTRGVVTFRGADVWAMRPRERRSEFGRGVGMVFQDPTTSLNRRMTVRAILRDPLDVHRWGESATHRQDRVAELLDLVGLPASAADALPGHLSGGQRQRVAIARALALGPRVLVADEPTSALDVSVRAQILNLLLDLRDRLGLAMVYISHDIQTVRRVADRVVTMYLGRIVEQTPASAVAADTAHPYSRALLSATPSLLHETTAIPLHGPVPSAVRPPTGCPFHTRCWRASERCAGELPEFSAVAGDERHLVRCWHPVRSPADLPALSAGEAW